MRKRSKRLKATTQSPEPLEEAEPAAASPAFENLAAELNNLGSDVEDLDTEFSKLVSSDREGSVTVADVEQEKGLLSCIGVGTRAESVHCRLRLWFREHRQQTPHNPSAC